MNNTNSYQIPIRLHAACHIEDRSRGSVLSTKQVKVNLSSQGIGLGCSMDGQHL